MEPYGSFLSRVYVAAREKMMYAAVNVHDGKTGPVYDVKQCLDVSLSHSRFSSRQVKVSHLNR